LSTREQRFEHNDAPEHAAQESEVRMHVQRSKRLSPAFVVAMIALFVALGGTAGAVVTATVPLAKRALVADNAKKLGGQTSTQIAAQASRAAQTAAQAPGPASTAAGIVSTTSQSIGTFAPNQEAAVSVVCAGGKKVIGGGFSSDGAVFSFDSHPANDTTWRMYLVNGDETQPAPNVTVYAICIG
jgi:hypothetical protein